MITLTSKKPKGEKAEKSSSATEIPSLPQVDLLPPEVRDGRRLGLRRRLLVYIVLGVVAVVILTIGFAYVVKTNADSRLAEAEDRAIALSAEKKKYSEVTTVIRAIADTKDVRDFSVVTAVDWAAYIDAIAAQLPDDVTIDTFDVKQASPTERASTAGDPVLATGLGTINFTATSPDLPEAADWVDALNLIAGLQDASIQVAARNDSSGSGGSGSTYSVTATVQINQLALLNREFDDREIETAGGQSDEETN
ncbi:hypothetical protein SAMN06309944_0027 [Micrococcales bacterium KH10]|nr:hypothetical protein SAMN06309944_0027 [Micrococcales bacterium KH10]